ncbi:hypothetical protein CH381_27395 [Leptospira sp. mixed culture ATI2-C-A1]|nr:hypothetical protein CH381_27395 [Leptospira sp. mixed culture ATI2-C-A1]
MTSQKIVISALILFFSNCESFQRYGTSRTKDALDVLTFSIEKNSIGASIFAWCLGGGFTIDSKTRGIGIRDGHLGIYEVSNNSNLDLIPLLRKESPLSKVGISNILINSSGHRQYRPQKRTQDKDYQALNLLTLLPIPSIPGSNKIVTYCNAPLKVEGSFGLYYGIRIGFNFTELLDLFAGLSTIDLLKDDE